MDGTHPFDIVEPVSILPPPLVPNLLDLVDLLVPAANVAAFAFAAASAPGPRPTSVTHLSKDKICKLPTVERIVNNFRHNILDPDTSLRMESFDICDH